MHKTQTFQIKTDGEGNGSASYHRCKGGSAQDLLVTTDGDPSTVVVSVTVTHPNGTEAIPFNEASMDPNGSAVTGDWDEFDIDGTMTVDLAGQADQDYVVYVGTLDFGRTVLHELRVPDGETTARATSRSRGGMIMAYATDSNTGAYTIASESRYGDNILIDREEISPEFIRDEWRPFPDGTLTIEATGFPSEGEQFVAVWIVE